MLKSDESLDKSTKKSPVKGDDVDMDTWSVVEQDASDPELKHRPHSLKHMKSLERILRQQKKKPFPEVERGALGLTGADIKEATKSLDRTLVSLGETTKSAAQFTSMTLGGLYSAAGSYAKRLSTSGHDGAKKIPALAGAREKAIKRSNSSSSNSVSSNSSRRSSDSGGYYIG